MWGIPELYLWAKFILKPKYSLKVKTKGLGFYMPVNTGSLLSTSYHSLYVITENSFIFSFRYVTIFHSDIVILPAVHNLSLIISFSLVLKLPKSHWHILLPYCLLSWILSTLCYHKYSWISTAYNFSHFHNVKRLSYSNINLLLLCLVFASKYNLSILIIIWLHKFLNNNIIVKRMIWSIPRQYYIL